MLPGTKTTLLKVLAFRGLTVQCGKETIIAEMDLILGQHSVVHGTKWLQKVGQGRAWDGG